jgi:hypothetical protein
MYNMKNWNFCLYYDKWLITADDDSDKRQTRPLVREGAPERQDRDCQRVTNTLSWADWLTDRQSLCDFDFDLGCGKYT